MKPMTNLIGSHHADMISVVAEAIRSVSSKARDVPILPGSLLLEELALDSLDLVAVILEIQDRFRSKSIRMRYPTCAASRILLSR